MALKPFYQIAGTEPKPQFLLKDHTGRNFGVVEHYETDRARATPHVLLEFFGEDPAVTRRPLVWVDLERWSVLAGHGKNLPDANFEAGLDQYLQSLHASERELRKERARKARFADIMSLAGQGYTIAYQEMFPGELKREDFPRVEISGKAFLVDDQYLVQPGDYRNQVTLVFVEEPSRENGSAGGMGNPPVTGNPLVVDNPPEAALICNWLFGSGYEVVTGSLREEQCHPAIRALVENPELEKIYKQRHVKMRREATLLGVKPKPYAPTLPGDTTP